ncbi:Hypothetical predicted protein [Paramuricea clavata]|uniref:Uncharacterized protein n=1 Tax=Paramuricea clavata TaxID=317549 RepID=A0A6S7GA17_PARCT|nr:Hypothetical predicted protein [Paramuricea clavata]
MYTPVLEIIECLTNLSDKKFPVTLYVLFCLGIPIYDDCVAYHENRCDRDSPSPYFIKARNAAGYDPNNDICRTQDQVPSCSGEGWTSIGILQNSTTLDHWTYESELWTAKGTDQCILNSQFWSANVTEICLASAVFNIQIPVEAPSLRSLFFEKRILNMNSQQWADSLVQDANPVFTTGCFEIGFNVGNESEDAPRARLGIVSTHGTGCSEGIYILGVGLGAPGLTGSYHGYYSNQDVNSTGSVSVYVRSRPVGQSSSTTGPPTTEPPTTGPPTMEPQSTGPPTMEPPTTGPPTMEPQTTGPPTTEPPTTGPPTTEPPTTGPPTTEPPTTGPPTMEPQTTGPPIMEP